jgi:hypothetical protein
MPDDAFDTASLRRRVLDAWAASPARFREDANAEEDYALGGYRDRVVVELAQNAADAAARAGVPGRLRLALRADGTLTAENTGAPLDAVGVEGLSTLRASGKRDDDPSRTVGRFGVGFAAVVAVCDEPRMVSRTGAVQWSRAQSRDLVAGIPALAEELAARGGNVPVLRLPFPAPLQGPDGTAPDDPPAHEPGPAYDTTVVLPLRDADAVALAGRLLAQTGAELLLALPALAEVTIEAGDSRRTLAAVRDGDTVTISETTTPLPNAPANSPAGHHTVTTWRTVAAGGPLDPALLADRPVEERGRLTWSVRWAVPVEGADSLASALGVDSLSGDMPAGDAAAMNAPRRLPRDVAPVVHAPTPSDEPLGLPALLLASFPLSPDRRHVAPGPLTDFLVERAADAYAALLPGLAPGHGLLDLVPGPVAAGELDVHLRQAILRRLPDLPFLPPAAGSAREETAPGAPARVSPRDAVLLDITAPPGLGNYLADLFPGLLGGPLRHPAYSVLGIRRMPMAELADALATLQRPASWWRGLYAALADVDPVALPELGALPVPLADGRLIRGPRGVLLPGPGLNDPASLAPLRLRVVDPGAVHPLLARLGALEATPRGVLDHPATIAAVDASLEEEDPEPIAEAVLGLVQAAGVQPGEYSWLADLALPTDDDQWDPAGDLLLPGGELADVVAPDADFGVVDPQFANRYGEQVLAAVGVLSSFGLLAASDVDFGDADPLDLDTDDGPADVAGLDLDGAQDWAQAVRARFEDGHVPPVAVEVTAVRDLELVDPARWPRALEILTTRPRLRAALVKPTRVRLPDGSIADVPSYTSWWLRTHPVLGGRKPADLRTTDADPLLDGLYDDVAGLSAALPASAGAGVARLLADPAITWALGIRASLGDLLAEPGGPDDLLDRLADPARPVTRQQLRSIWMALAAASTTADPPARIRAIHGGEVVVADADDVLVLDSPDLYPLVASRPLVLAPYDLALVLSELLDVAVASEQADGRVETAAERRPVPGLVHAVLPDAPESYLAHDKLVVDGVPVPWRCADGEVHAATPAGLACGLAWAAGQWHARHLLTTLLSSQDESARLLAEADLDPV